MLPDQRFKYYYDFEYPHRTLSIPIGAQRNPLAGDHNYLATDGGWTASGSLIGKSGIAHSDHTAKPYPVIFKWWADFASKAISIGKEK
jgi:hypothetical protein